MSGTWRKPRALGALVLGCLGLLLVLLGGLVSYGAHVAFDSDAFAQRAAESLGDPRVADFVAGRLTNALIDRDPNLIRIRPILAATAATIVGSVPFRAIVRQAARRSHELALTRSGQDVLLTVSDASTLFTSALAIRPDLARKVPEDVSLVLGVVNEGVFLETTQSIMRLGGRLRLYGRQAFWGGVLLLGVALALARQPRRAVLRVGLALVGMAAVILLTVELGGSVVRRIPEDRALGEALAGVWAAFSAGLWPRALALGAIGLLLTAGATALLERMDLARILRGAIRLLWDPTESKPRRVLRALVYLGAGSLAIVEPGSVSRLLVVLGGGLAAFLGLQELFSIVLPEIHKVQEQAASVQQAARRPRRVWRGALVATACVALFVLLASVFTRPEPVVSSPATVVTACNGSPELCDRRLNEVVFPAAHNAMAAADVPGWLWPNHTYGIPTQLRDGVRGFQIDVYPGFPAGDQVKTDLESELSIREKYEPILGPQGVDAAIRIRNRLIVADESPRTVYLCHGLCEIGATPFIPALEQIRKFLVLNPGEVIVMVIEDYVTPQEIAAAFEESGLIDLVYQAPPGPPWPTLREMIRTDQRVLVTAENDASGVPWYHQAFELFQETPYHFDAPSQFSCEPNRGDPTASLFQLNHWIATAPTSLPTDAKLVNAYDFLLGRARSCQEARDRLPNLLAVDFYDIGELMRVAATLNGLVNADGSRAAEGGTEP